MWDSDTVENPVLMYFRIFFENDLIVIFLYVNLAKEITHPENYKYLFNISDLSSDFI